MSAYTFPRTNAESRTTWHCRPVLVGTAPLAVARRRPVNIGRQQTPGTGSPLLEGGAARGRGVGLRGRMDSGVRQTGDGRLG